ncbi:MAG: ferredoxin [Bacteroidales bacterium]|nr:ferredoxin [Bacteroidales bacterium]
MIQNETELRQGSVLEAGRRMLTAARTAPKGKGKDNLILLLVDGPELAQLADYMDASVERHGRQFFHRDALNIRQAMAVVIMGTTLSNMGLNCGYCGFSTCEAKDKAGDLPCAFPLNDLGIALGSACATAADLRVDTRVMFSAGAAAMEMGWLGPDCKAAYAIPLSVTGKNPFFDRVSTRPQ